MLYITIDMISKLYSQLAKLIQAHNNCATIKRSMSPYNMYLCVVNSKIIIINCNSEKELLTYLKYKQGYTDEEVQHRFTKWILQLM